MLTILLIFNDVIDISFFKKMKNKYITYEKQIYNVYESTSPRNRKYEICHELIKVVHQTTHTEDKSLIIL